MNINRSSRCPVPTWLKISGCVAATLATALSVTHAASADNVRVRDDRVVSPAPGERVKLKNPDRNFVEKIVRLSMEKAEVSRIAAERTSNPRVRAFAEAVASDHAAMSRELSVVASDKGVVLPAKEMTGEKWLKRDAKSFDVDYLKKMISDHEDAVELFQEQARDGHDAELVSFARKHLPALQHHLQEASDLRKMMD